MSALWRSAQGRITTTSCTLSTNCVSKPFPVLLRKKERTKKGNDKRDRRVLGIILSVGRRGLPLKKQQLNMFDNFFTTNSSHSSALIKIANTFVFRNYKSNLNSTTLCKNPSLLSLFNPSEFRFINSFILNLNSPFGRICVLIRKRKNFLSFFSFF